MIWFYGVWQLIYQEEIHDQYLTKDPIKCVKESIKLIEDFSTKHDKEKVWDDLIKLQSVEDEYVKCRATDILVSASPKMPDKKRFGMT